MCIRDSAWVVTRYDDVMTVLHRYSAERTPTPDQLEALGLEALAPVARVMVRQMLYLDPPEHTRVPVSYTHLDVYKRQSETW